MLVELKVKDFAIIDELHVQFKQGLNILSGETGAGKTILLKGLSLLMGAKSSTETIRSGAKQATVEGAFDLSLRPDIVRITEEMGIPVDEDVLVVRRVLLQAGKSRVYVNGCLSTLTTLQNIVFPLIEVTGQHAPLIEMTGQHESKSLLAKSYQLELLDIFASCWQLRSDYKKLFSEYSDVTNEIDSLLTQSSERQQNLDFYQFQKEEIENFSPVSGEEIELESQYAHIKNSTNIQELSEQIQNLLLTDEGSAINRLQKAESLSVSLEKYDEKAAKKLEDLSQAKTLVEDALYSLETYLGNKDLDPEKIETLQERMSQLRKLQKKYGPTCDDILTSLENISQQINSIENSEHRLELLKKDQKAIYDQLEKLANRLHQKRKTAATELDTVVNKELNELNMKGVRFSGSIKKTEKLNSHGVSEIEFLIKNSVKDSGRPLAKFASGGELSRILLALKNVIGRGELPRSYIFDEVDTGVSGPTAEKVGIKLKSIARDQQVICVTHLPQVAAFASNHFLIEKIQENGQLITKVRKLKSKQRIEEVARLISGERITQTSLAHAKQLINSAN
jgi:DNA repair protein RecN (Recombination protein N)